MDMPVLRVKASNTASFVPAFALETGLPPFFAASKKMG